MMLADLQSGMVDIPEKKKRVGLSPCSLSVGLLVLKPGVLSVSP
jgi:hypothetical protein